MFGAPTSTSLSACKRSPVQDDVCHNDGFRWNIQKLYSYIANRGNFEQYNDFFLRPTRLKSVSRTYLFERTKSLQCYKLTRRYNPDPLILASPLTSTVHPWCTDAKTVIMFNYLYFRDTLRIFFHTDLFSLNKYLEITNDLL